MNTGRIMTRDVEAIAKVLSGCLRGLVILSICNHNHGTDLHCNYRRHHTYLLLYDIAFISIGMNNIAIYHIR